MRPPVQIGNANRAAHLILTGYGHWLPNDPRGSGSNELRKAELLQLGPIHLGRKRVRPARDELRTFHNAAKTSLAHEVLCFDHSRRSVIASGIATAMEEGGYTIWACAILRNHLHLVVRTHRDNAQTMLTKIADATSSALRNSEIALLNHPIWSDRPYKVFLRSAADVHSRIRYVEANPAKEKLRAQRWTFVTPCKL